MDEHNLQPHRYLGGTEMEYGLAPVFRVQGTQAPGEHPYTTLALTQLPPDLYLSDKGGYATNGARVYKDIGEKLEYCTPECTSYADTVHALIAGEQLVVEAVQKVVETCRELRNIQVLGRVVDDTGVTWGHHESYIVRRSAFDGKERADTPPALSLRAAMLAHFATRTIFTGGGILQHTPGDSAHVIPAQKIPRLSKEVTRGTTGSDKGLFNTRDEPLANERRWARLHVTNGDYNISPWASWLKLGSTAIIAYLAEIGYIDTTEAVRLPTGAALNIARGVGQNPDHRFLLADGTYARAVDVQEKFCNLAQKFKASYPGFLTPEDDLVLEHWQQALDDYRSDPTSLLYRVDWITRKHILERYQEKTGHVTFQQLAQAEKVWDDLNPTIGIGVRLRHATPMPCYDPCAIDRLKHEPPKGSRAELRGQIIRDYYPDYDLSVDWHRITLRSLTGSTIHIKMHNPFQAQLSPGITHLLSRLADGSSSR